MTRRGSRGEGRGWSFKKLWLCIVYCKRLAFIKLGGSLRQRLENKCIASESCYLFLRDMRGNFPLLSPLPPSLLFCNLNYCSPTLLKGVENTLPRQERITVFSPPNETCGAPSHPSFDLTSTCSVELFRESYPCVGFEQKGVALPTIHTVELGPLKSVR